MYDPTRHYWTVGGDEAHVYSSASAAYVPVTDEAYLAWVEGGHRVTIIDTADNLADVLEAAGITGAPFGYAVDLERDRRIAAGATFNGVLFQTRPDDLDNISGSAQLAALAIAAGAQAGDLTWAGGAGNFAWIAADNSLVPMDAQTVIAFGKAVAARKTALIFAGRDIKNRLAAGTVLDVLADSNWPA